MVVPQKLIMTAVTPPGWWLKNRNGEAIMNKVENLKMITLCCEAGTSQAALEIGPNRLKFKFIFGLGLEGMTPFEYKLVDKVEGDRVEFILKKTDCFSFFGHLTPSIINLVDNCDEVYLKATIEGITAANSREIIQAMAEMTAHGGAGCDCGCGCG
jgi:hypothetical protein